MDRIAITVARRQTMDDMGCECCCVGERRRDAALSLLHSLTLGRRSGEKLMRKLVALMDLPSSPEFMGMHRNKKPPTG